MLRLPDDSSRRWRREAAAALACAARASAAASWPESCCDCCCPARLAEVLLMRSWASSLRTSSKVSTLHTHSCSHRA